MHYIIDGYNLMFRILRAGDELQAQRQALIKDLNNKFKALNLSVTLIFDAQYRHNESTSLHLNKLEIHFTEHGEIADEYIVKLVKRAKNPLAITVVTSDKKLAWLVRLKNGKTESVEDFIKWLNNKYKNKLRRDKEPIPVISLPPVTKKVVIEPTLDSSPKDCFDFYLQKFEEEYTQIVAKEPTTQEKASSHKAHEFPKKPKIKKAPKISNEDRWLQAFQRDITDES